MSVFSNDDGDDQVNDLTTHSNQHTPRTYEDYQQLRKAAPSRYYSAAMQQRMYDDAAALGKAKFFAKSKSSKWWDNE